MPQAVIGKRTVRPPETHMDPTRLIGALAAGVDFTQDDAFFERIDVRGLQHISVVVKLSAVAVVGTLTVNGHRMDSVASADDTDGTRLLSGNPTPVSLTTADTEVTLDIPLNGEAFIDVEAVMSSGVSDVAELAFVDIFGTPAA